MYYITIHMQNYLIHIVLLFVTLQKYISYTLLIFLDMAVHIGKKIKEELHKQGMGATDFAKKINKSRNVVYDIFERESIDTALLSKICNVLKFDFFALYNTTYKLQLEKPLLALDEKTRYNTEFEHLSDKIKLLENEISYLKKIIDLLESKENKTKPKKSKTAHK